MRFETVRAHPFGPFRDETLRFAPGMNVVYGPNEAGKSTWHAALYAGLCGMRRGRGASAEDRRFRDRHRPWDAGGAWAVSAVVALEDGRRVELRQDLATKIDCRASDADRAGRDYTNEILHDGAPDGSRWLGLNRKTFVAASSVRQAQILGLLDDPGALQEDLQRAAATAGTDETAARALDLLDHYRREQVGSAQARSRPLRLARDRVAEARAAVERARRSQAAYRDHAARVERLEGEAESGEERLAALRAARAEREAAEAERRAARAAELAALFPDGPPRRADDDRVAERAAAALATWRARPTPRPLSGPAVEALERELDAAAEPDGSEPAPAAGAGRAWAPYLAGAAMVAGIALALADSQVAALVAAGLGPRRHRVVVACGAAGLRAGVPGAGGVGGRGAAPAAARSHRPPSRGGPALPGGHRTVRAGRGRPAGSGRGGRRDGVRSGGTGRRAGELAAAPPRSGGRRRAPRRAMGRAATVADGTVARRHRRRGEEAARGRHGASGRPRSGRPGDRARRAAEAGRAGRQRT